MDWESYNWTAFSILSIMALLALWGSNAAAAAMGMKATFTFLQKVILSIGALAIAFFIVQHYSTR